MEPIIVVIKSPHSVQKTLDLIADLQTEDWKVVKGFDAREYLYARVIDLLQGRGIQPN